jgi:hypothetical protein
MLMSLKNLLITLGLVGLLSVVMASCDRKDPLTGCASSNTGVRCDLRGINFISDVDSVEYDTINHRYLLYAKDDFYGTSLQITVFAPLQDYEGDGFKIKPTAEYGSAIATAQGDNKPPFFAQYGNIAINVDFTRKVVCGQFKFYASGSDEYVSQGEFKAVPIYYKKP